MLTDRCAPDWRMQLAYADVPEFEENGPAKQSLDVVLAALVIVPSCPDRSGRSARTRFAGMPVIVRCTRPSTFQCIVTASYCDYLASWLADAALEFVTTP
jgi:hypothetical protein